MAVGALTISTAATMQFPNAIGMMIDILNGVDVAAVTESGMESTQMVNGKDSALMLHEQKMQMKSIAVEMMGYFTVGAVCTAIHSAMFDSVGQAS
jgi:hypothetical protein